MSRAAEIVKLEESWRMERVNFDTTVQEIIDHIDSQHRDVSVVRAPGEKKDSRIFDGTARYANDLFADFYQGSVFNPQTKWFTIQHREEAINAKPENSEWLAETRDTALKLMRTFYGPGGQAIGEWALFGNGPVLVEEVPRKRATLERIRFTACPWGSYVMAQGDDGRIDQFIRRLKLTAAEIVGKVGENNITDEIRRAYEKNEQRKFDVLHSILPRNMQKYSKSATRTNKEFDWASCWVEPTKKMLMYESGYRMFPVAVARYRQISGEVYARGLGEVALADAKTSNLMRELTLLWGARQLDPPTLTRRNSIINGILNKEAKGNTIVTGDPRTAVVPLFEGNNLPTFEHLQKEITSQIMRVFHVEEILNLLSREGPQMTAFEVNQRLNLLQEILGPVFGQNDVEFFNPIIALVLDIAAHAGLLTDAPDDIAQGDTKDVLNFIYEGPLARAQKNQELLAIQQTAADFAGMQPFYPDIVHLADWEAMARAVAEIRGTNRYLKSNEQFVKDVNAAIAQQNAQQAAAMLAGGAQAIGQAGPGVKALAEAQQVGRQAA